MKHWPLGWKLTTWSVCIVAAALGLSLWCTRTYVRGQEMAELDAQLADEIARFFDQFHRNGSRLDWVTAAQVELVIPSARAPDHLLLVTDGQGHLLYHSDNQPPEAFLKYPRGFHDALAGGNHVRLAVVPDDKRLTVYLAGDTAEIDDLTTEITHGYLVALPIVLSVVACGGWWLARQALQPVKNIADAAEAIRLENLSTRLGGEDQRDETGRLVQVFNDMLARLERGFQQATRFSADASHELRTPLTVLRSGLDGLLQERNLSEPHREAVAELQLQTSGLIALVNSLLLLARADAGHLRLDLTAADLSEAVAECVEDARIVAGQRGVRVECAPLPVAPVQADPTRIRQIVSNLLDNAVKYNFPGGRVAVRLESADGWHCLRIGNEGSGIPALAQPNLFKRFYRAGQQEDQPGAGLGLSLARELARSHGGEVTLSEAREDWTEFKLRLPIKEDRA